MKSDVRDLEAVIFQTCSSECSGPGHMEKIDDTGLVMQLALGELRESVIRQYMRSFKDVN